MTPDRCIVCYHGIIMYNPQNIMQYSDYAVLNWNPDTRDLINTCSM